MNDVKDERGMVEEAYEKLSELDKKKLAKYAGKTMDQLFNVYPIIYRVMPRQTEKNISEKHFAYALCMRSLFYENQPVLINAEKMMAKTMKRDVISKTSLDTKIGALMSVNSPEKFCSKLAQLCRIMADTIPENSINGDKLYWDMWHIQHDKTVQKDWAKACYGTEETNETNKNKQK